MWGVRVPRLEMGLRELAGEEVEAGKFSELHRFHFY
jgi:hypothetical protein